MLSIIFFFFHISYIFEIQTELNFSPELRNVNLRKKKTLPRVLFEEIDFYRANLNAPSPTLQI